MAVPKKAPKATTCRMFDTPFIEWFSRIHPATPFLFWIPVIVALAGWSLYVGVAPGMLAGLMVAGFVLWTFAEYMLHRYVFHFIGPQGWKRRFQFIFHGVHHDFPQDAARLVMPLGVSVPIGLVFYLLMSAALPGPMAVAMMCGFGIGYLTYDGIHYATHHARMKSRLGKYLKRYHMVHHFTGLEGMWGVSSPVWDWIFGTAEDLREKRGTTTRAAQS
jgi:sterol desaturase/sphingolipid hydroxylase (fatty acid hydroxylase superfamily)